MYLIGYLKFIKLFILFQALLYPIQGLKNSFQSRNLFFKIIIDPVQTIRKINCLI